MEIRPRTIQTLRRNSREGDGSVAVMGDWNLQDWKMTDELAGGGICKTGK